MIKVGLVADADPLTIRSRGYLEEMMLYHLNTTPSITALEAERPDTNVS